MLTGGAYYDKAMQVAEVPEALHNSINPAQVPYADIILILLVTLILGICVGYLVRKKSPL